MPRTGAAPSASSPTATPPSLFLRDTALTQADDAIRDFALDLRANNSGNTLAELHALLNRLHEETVCERDTTRPSTATAVEADPAEPQGGGHAWAEAYVPGLGWVGFDTVNCVCPAEAHVRVAVGLDALGAAPVRGTRYGVGEESAAIAIRVDQ